MEKSNAHSILFDLPSMASVERPLETEVNLFIAPCTCRYVSSVSYVVRLPINELRTLIESCSG